MSLFHNPLGLIAGLLLAFVFVRFLVWGLNAILVWMDWHDWILIPNKHGMAAADAVLARMALEAQAVYEPGKKHLLEAEAKRQDMTSVTEQGGSAPPGR